MKKLLVASVLALALVAGSQQTASAWSHFKIGIGMNVDWSCGNNNLLWGAYRSGQVPEGHGGPLDGYYAPAPIPYGQPGFYAPSPTPVQRQTGPAASQLASYPAPYYYQAAYQGNYYQPASNYQPANYHPMSYYQPSYYYPMSYTHGYPQGFSFYGN